MIETLRTGSAPGREHADERVAGLVVGDAAAVLLGEHDAARGAEHDLLQRLGEVRVLDLLVVAARGEQRGLVGEVGEVGADHARRRGGDAVEVDVVGERQRARVDLEDLAPAVLVGRRHGDAAVEAAGAQQRLVEDLRAVGGAEHDHRDVGLEAVHLGEDLVERLLALVVAAAERDALASASARSRRARR